MRSYQIPIIFISLLSYFHPIYSYKISLEDGVIEGYSKVSHDGREYLAFEGIPYASPPIEELRLKPPKRIGKWRGTLIANQTIVCLQIIQHRITGSEDCLYLNVYVPRKMIIPSEKLPVLVHFHGGGFLGGDPNSLAGPSKFMDRDVIYVSGNYRVGVLGFFSSGDETISGNFGLKDQNFILRWVQRNIESFGGDKECVTIIGMSAGGCSVHLHYFSPLSQGLFHKGISQSGSALDPLTFDRNPETLRLQYLKDINCVSSDSKQVLKCIQSKNKEELLKPISTYVSEYFLPLVLFRTIIEPQSEGAFIALEPLDLLENREFNDAPFMITVTDQEAIYPTVFFINKLSELNVKWHDIADDIFDYSHFDSDEKYKISSRIRTVFFNNGDITKENFKTFSTLATKRLFDLTIEKSALLHSIASKHKIYLLKYGYGGDVLTWDVMTNQTLNLGIGHGEDSRFYYDNIYHNPVLTENEIKLKDTLLDTVMNFCRYGEAKISGFEWKPLGYEQPIEYLLINGPTDFKMVKSTNKRYELFWSAVDRLKMGKDEL